MKGNSDWKQFIPREHGAWGILLGSFLTAIAYEKHFVFFQLVYFLSIVAFYFIHEPVVAWLRGKSSREGTIFFSLAAGTGLLLFLLAIYLSGYPEIIRWSLLLPAFFFLELLFIRFRKQMSFAAQLSGTLGLATVAPLTDLLWRQQFTNHFWMLWGITGLFFTAGILFVRYQIALSRPSNGIHGFRLTLFVYILIVFSGAIFCRYKVLFLSNFPLALQVLYFLLTRRQISNLRLVGWLQMMHSLLFVLLMGFLG